MNILACGACGGTVEPLMIVAVPAAGLILTNILNRIRSKRHRRNVNLASIRHERLAH